MAGTLTVIWWRDIPAQVVVRDGRQTAKIVLHPRFQVAIDKAAVKAGRKAMDDYIAEWRKTQTPCARRAATRPPGRGRRLEHAYTREVLARLVAAGGVDETAPTTECSVTRTVVGSATRDVVIGDDQPFVIIGERINPTGRKLLAEEMKAGDFSRVERDVVAQVEAGAHMLDVNAGMPARRRAGDAGPCHPAGPGADGPAALDRFLDRRRARGGPRRLPGQGARQLGDRRGGAARAGPAPGAQVRRGGRRHLQRRDRHLRGPRRALRGREDASWSGRWTTASRART